MQTRDEKCIAFLAFFAKQKATQRIKNLKLDICLIVKYVYNKIEKTQSPARSIFLIMSMY